MSSSSRSELPHHPPWRRRRQLHTALPWWQSWPPSDACALPRAVVVAAGARARLIHLVAGGLRGGPYDSTPSPSSLAEIRSPRQDLPPPPWRDPSPAAAACGRDPPQAASRCRPGGTRRWAPPPPGEILRRSRQGAARSGGIHLPALAPPPSTAPLFLPSPPLTLWCVSPWWADREDDGRGFSVLHEMLLLISFW